MPLSRRVSFSPAAEWRGELLWIAITRPVINPSLTSLRRPRRYCWTVMILHISVPQAVFSQSLRRRHKTENTRCAGNVCELLISSLPGGFCSPVPCVCMCGCALLATAFMLHTGWFKIYAARPFWHWRELLQKQKKKVKWKGCSISDAAAEIYGPTATSTWASRDSNVEEMMLYADDSCRITSTQVQSLWLQTAGSL